MSRRQLLVGGLGTAGGALLLATGLAGPASAAGTALSDRPTHTSLNGWPVLLDVPAVRVEGSDVAVAVLSGDVATVLLHCVRRFAYELAGTLSPEDVVGHIASVPASVAYESNYMSGTALAIRPSAYPVGAEGGFFARELVLLRDILADCEGVVRWGGDLRPAKESHFQIDVEPGDPRLRTVAAKIDGWRRLPDSGAGSAIDPSARDRLTRARDLEIRQCPG